MNLTWTYSVQNRHRRRRVSKGFIDEGGNAECDLVFKGPGNYLDADGQALRAVTYWNNRSRAGQHVKPLCETHSIEIPDSAAFDVPRALAVAPRGDASHGRQEQGIRAHFHEGFRAEPI
jgi:hypothetical protein